MFYIIHLKKKILLTSRKNNSLYKIDINSNDNEFYKLFELLNPNALVINTIAMLNSNISTLNNADIENAISVNSLFPYRLSRLINNKGLRLIHVSTDAVFSHKSKSVYEDSLPNPDSIYGYTKLLGEVINGNILNIRCSFIGPSLDIKNNIWSKIHGLEKNTTINGYENHNWSGVTINQFCEICHYLFEPNNFFEALARSNIHHFCPNKPISKFDLMKLIANQIRPDVTVIKHNDKLSVTRNLVSNNDFLNSKILINNYNWSKLIKQCSIFFNDQIFNI